jgi:hypothetical protein
MRRPRTQTRRVLKALQQYPGGITQLDFDGPTIDRGPPIRRLASRVNDLREDVIDSSGRRNAMALYVLRSEPTPADPSRNAPASRLFERTVGAAPPLSPYDPRADA